MKIIGAEKTGDLVFQNPPRDFVLLLGLHWSPKCVGLIHGGEKKQNVRKEKAKERSTLVFLNGLNGTWVSKARRSSGWKQARRKKRRQVEEDEETRRLYDFETVDSTPVSEQHCLRDDLGPAKGAHQAQFDRPNTFGRRKLVFLCTHCFDHKLHNDSTSNTAPPLQQPLNVNKRGAGRRTSLFFLSRPLTYNFSFFLPLIVDFFLLRILPWSFFFGAG